MQECGCVAASDKLTSLFAQTLMMHNGSIKIRSRNSCMIVMYSVVTNRLPKHFSNHNKPKATIHQQPLTLSHKLSLRSESLDPSQTKISNKGPLRLCDLLPDHERAKLYKCLLHYGVDATLSFSTVVNACFKSLCKSLNRQFDVSNRQTLVHALHDD